MLNLSDIIRIADQPAREAALAQYYRQEDANRTQRLIDLTEENIATRLYASVQTCSAHIPIFDGHSPLRDFVQDVENARSMLPSGTEPYFLRAVIAKLRGKARECLEGQSITTVDVLIKLLKNQFAPSKPYVQYILDITLSSMKQGESVRNYHARLTSLMRSACAALEDILGKNDGVNHLNHLEVLALQSFMKGIHESWRATLANAAPKTFNEALDSAINIEKYHGYTGLDSTGVYHIYHHGLPAPTNPTPVRTTDNRIRIQEHYVQPQYNDEQVYDSFPNEKDGNARYVSYDDSGNYNRREMPYHYNSEDTAYRGTEIRDGRIRAPSALAYGSTSNNSNSNNQNFRPRSPYRHISPVRNAGPSVTLKSDQAKNWREAPRRQSTTSQ